MNVTDGLKTIRERLVANNANPATVKHVDDILKRASTQAASGASAQSLLQLNRMLMRHPTTASNNYVYNDLALLEEQLEAGAAESVKRAEDEFNRPQPKLKKYYKEQKEKKSS
jgi:hypothetical protein